MIGCFLPSSTPIFAAAAASASNSFSKPSCKRNPRGSSSSLRILGKIPSLSTGTWRGVGAWDLKSRDFVVALCS